MTWKSITYEMHYKDAQFQFLLLGIQQKCRDTWKQKTTAPVLSFLPR